MPFVKRSVEPQLLCRPPAPGEAGGPLQLQDLCSTSHLALARTLRQLSDLARHACSIFQELEDDVLSTHQRVRGLQKKIHLLQQTTFELDAKQEAVPVSDLDVESKLTLHYQAPWTQQRNIFLPATRPACLEELHHLAQNNLRSLQRDHQQRRALSRERRVTICVSVAPPADDHPSPHSPLHRKHRARSVSTAVRCDLDSELVLLGQRSKFPIPNLPSTLDRQTNWSSALPLPTPAQRMKSDSQVINSCIIPINVTGVGFDRDASVRCSLVHSQSLLQRRRKLRRRRTVAGVPRQVHLHFDSDESPSSTDRTLIFHPSPDATTCSEGLSLRLSTTRDSGCQTEDFPPSSAAAATRRRVRAHRGPGTSYPLSVSAGNISSLPDDRCHRNGHNDMFANSRLRSRSLPRDASRLTNRSHSVSDEDEEEEEEEEELSPFDAEDFLSGGGGDLKDDEEEGGGSMDDQAVPERQRGGLGYQQRASSPEHGWPDRRRSSSAHMGSCEMSSSSDTFSSPMHSVSAAGVLGGGPMDHKDDHQMDHQSSSGNWSGSSSTCPSHTSETLPPAASPQLTGSSHCDSELSLNAASHATDEVLDHDPLDGRFPGLRTQRAGSFSSTAMDILEDAALGAASEGEWGYTHANEPPCSQGFTPEPRPQSFSPEPSREPEGSLGCPSFTSMATCESSFSDKPPSEKADTVSHYSVDTEGYYTSMHFDCGLKESQSFPYSYAAATECGMPDFSSDAARSRRCLSLKKSKAKPSPPKRSSSLRQICSEGNVLDQREPKISCGQQGLSSSKERRLNLDLGGSLGRSETPSLTVAPPETWALEDCEGLQDAVSCASTDTHSFKDEGAVQSDYADLWLLNDLKSNDTYRSLSNSSTATGTTVIECIKSQESSGSQTSQSDSRATTPSLPSLEGSEFKLPSPENLAGLASPSSGYSSQSETPTSFFPSAFFPSPLSPPSGKRKPKVPERKSSLSSFQFRASRDGGSSSKSTLELPIIPPSNLDLSGLQHKPGSSVLALRNQMQLLKQNKKQKPSGSGRSEVSCKSEVPPMRLMSITPTVLHSIQLRSFSKEPEKPRCEKTLAHTAPTPRDPPGSLLSTLSGSTFSEFRDHPVYASFIPSSFQESYEPPPPFNWKEPGPGGVAAEEACPSDVIDSQDRHADTASLTAFLDQSPEQSASACDGEAESCTWCSVHPKGETSEGSTVNLDCPSSPEDTLVPPETQLADEELPYLRMTTPGLTWGQDQTASRYELPVKKCLSEPSQQDQHAEGVEDETLSSSWSSSQDSKEEASPDAEEAFSKGSTSSGNLMSSPSEENVTPSVMSPPNNEPRSEEDSVFQSPSKTRTTEDLFAMIHRSKRKVLGRRDSAELGVRSRLGAASRASSPTPMSTPPSTPTPPAQPLPASPSTPSIPGGIQKAPSPIYRSVKKSSTSSEEFKLLLLRKGSRSDASYRMSASEILRSPTGHRAPGGPLGDDEPPPPLSALQQQLQGVLSPGSPEAALSPLPRANGEGFSPKASPSGARQGRSRAPPPATSSRYAARCRFFAAPMQAISEGEGENSDGSPHDDRPSSGCS